MRDGASSVAAGTPKKGTKAASFAPKSMSGRLKNASPRLIARISARAPSCRAYTSTPPKRSRPRRTAASKTGLVWAW